VAVGWGGRSLREISDETLVDTGPAAVADYIRRVIEIITSRQIAAIVVACYQQLTKDSC
jgi:hypothetical protein